MRIKLITIFTLCASAFINASQYTLEDLKILAQEKSFEEYFAHAKDIRPSKRDLEWQKMTLDLSLLYIDKVKQQQSTKEDKLAFELASWPA